MALVARLLTEVERRLEQAPVWSGYVRGNRRTEARLLVGYALDLDAFEAAALDRRISRDDVDAVNVLLRRRVRTGVPTPYLVGRTRYDGMILRVDQGTFVPRNALEFVLDEVVAEVVWSETPRALDLCCGVGAVGLGVARRHADVLVDQADLDELAVTVAKDNAVRHGVEDRCTPLVSDLFDALPVGRRYDLVTINPPYIPQAQEASTCREVRAEPPGAIFSRGDGLALARAVLAQVAGWLSDDGLFALEVGPWQHDHVDWLLAGRGTWWEHRGKPLHLVTIRRLDLVR